MKSISLYRTQFKTIDGDSEFDSILVELNLPDNLDEIEIKTDGIKFWNGDSYQLKEF